MSWPYYLEESASTVDYVKYSQCELNEQLFDREAPRLFRPHGSNNNINMRIIDIRSSSAISRELIQNEKQLRGHCMDIAMEMETRRRSGPPDDSVTRILHPELHRRETSKMPWTIRQMAICQNSSIDLKTETNIILHSSGGTTDRLDTLVRDSTAESSILKYLQHWTTIHSLVLIALEDEWKNFINYMEETVATMAAETLFPQLSSSDQEEDNAIQMRIFHKIQECQSTIDWLIRTKQALQLNVETVDKLSCHMKEAYEHEKGDLSENDRNGYHSLSESIKNCIYGQNFAFQNVTCLLERASRAAFTFRDIASQRDSYVIKTLARLSKRAADETSALTSQSIREAQIMKSITLLALIFLPATFIVGFLDLDYISVTKTPNGSLQLEAKPEIFLLLALAIPLTVAVVGGWYVWQYRSNLKNLFTRRRQKKQVVDVESTF
ncbi:hypothetical protein TWF970_005748 [Orbilia oligospora]|uniref:Uncharacterized protein n=1 Tax=Orbilia oligospora TaxID=2813651 RepID=A0A7C8RG90_ORBOL|nr:hypothetical protein TWF970_005748 [Orbilia oligospora]